MASSEEVKEATSSDFEDVADSMKEYYGKTLKERDQVKTGVCELTWTETPRIQAALSLVHEVIMKRYLGCGLPFPDEVEGCNALDLGCGTGRDTIVLSQLVGPTGKVVGVDMTQEQLDTADEHLAYHMEMFGYDSPNVDFRKGYLEDLQAAGILDNFFDIAVSNGVICLCKDKKQVLGEAFRAMKVDGEIFISDVYASKRQPEEAKADQEGWGLGLSGSLYWRDLHEICKEIGFSAPALVVAKRFPLRDERLMEIFGGIDYVAATYRIFKPIPTVDQIPASVEYKGTIVDNTDSYTFAMGIDFPKGQSVDVDGELAGILKSTRYAKHFEFGPVSRDASHLLKIGEENPFRSSP